MGLDTNQINPLFKCLIDIYSIITAYHKTITKKHAKLNLTNNSLKDQPN